MAKTKLEKFIKQYSVRNKQNSGYPVYSVTNAKGFCTEYFSKDVSSVDKTNYKIVPKGFFAYNPSRINVGSVDWQHYKENVVVSPLYVVFSCSQLLDQQYLLYFLKSRYGQEMIRSSVSGSVRFNLKFKVLSKFELNIGTIDDQKRAIKQLDSIKSAIECENKKLDLLDEIVKSRFIEMFGEIHSASKFAYRQICSFTDVVSGGTPNRAVNDYWQNGTIPWIKTTELQNNVISNAEEKITKKALDESSAKLVPPKTILLAMYGQGKTRGMTGFLSIPAATNQACACILPSKAISQEFLWYYMMFAYELLREMAKGCSQPNLNGKMIKHFNVLFPPDHMQQEFVTFAKQIDKSKFIIQKRISLYQELLNKESDAIFN